jgi:hypothetical protein
LLAWLLALAASGCGYQLVRYGGKLGSVDSLAIATLRNDSYDPGLELIVAEAFRREALRRGAPRLAADREQAALTLSGSVPPVATQARSFSSVVLALEYEITLRLELTARLRDGTQIPLEARVLRETERYLASADLEAMSALLAGRVMDALAEELAP